MSEPVTFSALLICLQNAQRDAAVAIEDKNVRVKLAAQYEAEAYKLRAVIAASGTENQRRVVELQDRVAELQQIADQVPTMMANVGELQWLFRALQGMCHVLQLENQKLQADAARLENLSNDHLRLWIEEVRQNAELSEENHALKRANKRNGKFLTRARLTRNKLRRRLYALQRKVRKAA